MFNMSINVRVDAGQFSAAAKLCLEIAEIYVAEEQHESAADFFVKAADYYESADNMGTSALDAQKKAADSYHVRGMSALRLRVFVWW